ncbi:MAG: hypothetical protein E7225_01085 [Clostridiales bacterium]|nr:hypothetical protein [Clostridiales bacterium]
MIRNIGWENVSAEKLLKYGFERVEDNCEIFSYTKEIVGGQFLVKAYVSLLKEKPCFSYKVFDASSDDEYIMHKIPGATGTFVGQIREEASAVMSDILEKCFGMPGRNASFRSRQAEEIISYAREKYDDEPEFLWEKFPDCAVLRRKDTKKWYAVILTTTMRKFGYDSDETTEVLDLKTRPEEMEGLVDNKNYFPGYHMNKKHWYTIVLDGRVTIEEIFKRIDASHELVGPKKASKQ